MTPERGDADRLTIDVSVLPAVAFGHRGLLWWATVMFMAIEGTTLAIAATAYFYLRMSSEAWPPRPNALPDVLLPTVNVALLLLKLVPVGRAEHAAKRFQTARVRGWMVATFAFCLATTVLRGFELGALNVRWDTNAYGSAVWAMVVAHTSLLVTDVFEVGAITAIFFSDRLLPKHFSDVEDVALYSRFLSVSWLVLYLILHLAPRVL